MYPWSGVAISDGQFRVGVIAAGLVLALGITAVRFCGSVGLPPKPAAPSSTTESSSPTDQLLSHSANQPAVYRDFLAQDAQSAGVRAPTIDDMARKLPYRVDDARHVLELGKRTVIAGLELTVLHAGESLALDIRNTTQAPVAYLVMSAPVPSIAGCETARPLPFDAMVIARGDHETRVECMWRPDMAIAITRVETLELSPLQTWYVDHLPPDVLGIEPRIARGHRGPTTKDPKDRCVPMLGQAVRNGVESGEIGWRDLVDFYARHRCQTYSFPLGYRAFTADSQHSLPVSATGR